MLVLFMLLSSAVIIKDLAFLPFSPIRFYFFAVFSIQDITIVTVKFLRRRPNDYYWTLDFFSFIDSIHCKIQ